MQASNLISVATAVPDTIISQAEAKAIGAHAFAWQQVPQVAAAIGLAQCVGSVADVEHRQLHRIGHVLCIGSELKEGVPFND